MGRETEEPTHERWDAGDTGCGQLVVGIHRRLDAMRPGQTLEVIANDAGAPVDLPAWCRMTGHTLVSAEHPTYVIRRKSD
jgi:tRNA 2-thiouridine synthesizing protein A